MPNLGMSELLVIFLIVIVLFGASRLPAIGRGLGEGITNFKKGLKGKATEDAMEEPKTTERSSS
ncbi:MAG: twin-arginine translocase TatA/TatE family subunit [Acidobacteria bacterium]|nr:twin-arginine translocase TatA/TatE family subunit [Acidobacteriota bacterium]